MLRGVTAARSMARHAVASRINVTANGYGNGAPSLQLTLRRRARASAQRHIRKILKIFPGDPATGPAATNFSSPRRVLPSNISVAARVERLYGVSSNANVAGASGAGAAFDPGVGVSMTRRQARIECRQVLVGRVGHSIFAASGRRERGRVGGRPSLCSLSCVPVEQERA